MPQPTARLIQIAFPSHSKDIKLAEVSPQLPVQNNYGATKNSYPKHISSHAISKPSKFHLELAQPVFWHGLHNLTGCDNYSLDWSISLPDQLPMKKLMVQECGKNYFKINKAMDQPLFLHKNDINSETCDFFRKNYECCNGHV